MTTTTAPTRRPRRLPALVKAEHRQFWRNKTLIYMGTIFPIGLPLLVFFLARREMGTTAALAAITLEMFALTALLFVVYYSVLSLVTTRRGEGVLKRLRTGEAKDHEILTAPAVPGAALTVVGSIVVAAVIYVAGAPAPVNPVLIVAAVLIGIVIFALLGLATSAMTRNAEAAQITSLPVIMLAVAGMGSMRAMLPDELARVADWTPFAAVSDLVSLGAAGVLPSDLEAAAMTMSETFTEAGRPLATLVLWAVIALDLARRYFRWDERE